MEIVITGTEGLRSLQFGAVGVDHRCGELSTANCFIQGSQAVPELRVEHG
jgi:hypothetical protein